MTRVVRSAPQYPASYPLVNYTTTKVFYILLSCRFHQIRHKIQVNCTEKWIQFFKSSENETSWDLVPREKGTNNVQGFYILISYADLRPLGIPIVKCNLAWFSGVGFCTKSKGKTALMWTVACCLCHSAYEQFLLEGALFKLILYLLYCIHKCQSNWLTLSVRDPRAKSDWRPYFLCLYLAY
jgi:hypothetical protein